MNYKIVYCAKIDDSKHCGMLKVGDTEFAPSKCLTDYQPNDPELQKAAMTRIKGWSGTAAAGAELIYCDTLIRYNDKTLNYEDYRDGVVHKVLQNAGFPKVEFDSSTDSGSEWFKVDIETVKAAVKASKEWRNYLDASEMPQKEIYPLREEQQEAVDKTIKRYKNGDDMLWHAKMRFGKTVTALNLVKKEGYKRTIIITHRPVVEDSWGSDFYHVFGKEDNYVFLTKISDKTVYNDDETDPAIDKANDDRLKKLYEENKPFVYFASIQDLRGSKRVHDDPNDKAKCFDKNNIVFDIDWDFVIIDEAHEGTKTELGQKVINTLIKYKDGKQYTKKLDLSGTAYNLLDKYSDDKSVFTWDYVMEQTAKMEWPKKHPGEPNPYADMPVMNIKTYDLKKAIKEQGLDISEKAFTFHEFFRTWTGDMSKDSEPIPAFAKKGEFVHKDSVKHFLDLLSINKDSSKFPFVDIEGCKQNTHTLWMVPGVKEAAALSEMLRNHPFFSMFGVANVAGEGDHDEETHFDNALKLVRNTIEKNERSITLSCGRLTTGVTVKEWTSVFMLSGSDDTDAKQYMQTIFRVQSAGKINGVQKKDCYVYDFAPDRALVVIAAVAGARKSKKGGVVLGGDEQRDAFKEFLNFCPVLAIDGAEFKPFSVENLVSQVNRVHIDRALKTGFMDNCIYDMGQFKALTGDDVDKLNDIFTKMKGTAKKPPLSKAGTTKSGLGGKQTGGKQGGDSASGGKKGGDDDKTKAYKKLVQDTLDRLRTVSIRIPLLFYGGDFDVEEGRLGDVITGISDASWNVFMPGNLTKDDFRNLVKYYNQETVIGAAKVIRNKTAEADALSPTERVIAIANIFGSFHNPSHETVLTTWRVVNMHMADTMGGYCFYNDKFEENDNEYYHRLQEPRFVVQGNVTKAVLANPDSKVLEINSKSGLYPLYVTYSLYRAKLKALGKNESEMTPDESQIVWDEAAGQVYVICQSEMSVSITLRTLFGYRKKKSNTIKTEDDLLDQLKQDIPAYANKVITGYYWGEGDKKMKFDAVVGNPPYQEEVANRNEQPPVYHFFYDMAFELANKATLITPARFLFNAGKTPEAWNNKMLNDEHFKITKYYDDSREVFPSVEIKGGVAIGYRDSETFFGAMEVFVANKYLMSILKKVMHKCNSYLNDIWTSNTAYCYSSLFFSENADFDKRVSGGSSRYLSSSVFDKFPEVFFNEMPHDGHEYVEILGRQNNTRRIKYFDKRYLTPPNNFNKYKVFLASSSGSGKIGEAFTEPIIGKPYFGATETFFSIGNFDTETEANYLLKYLKTKFARVMLSTSKVTQAMKSEKVWVNVPAFSFSENDVIDWNQTITEIDEQLFEYFGLSEKEVNYIKDTAASMDELSVYQQMLNLSYDKLVAYLLKKYGAAKHNYFKDTGCTVKNPLVTRTAEGLYCHHIDEDKAIMLCNDKFAAANPFDYQKANRLVYCNLLEHLLLHVKIAENPSEQANEGKLPGIGGAINFICKDLNDIYAGKEFVDEWRKTVADKVKDDFDDYILVLKHLWNVVESNPLYKAIITKEMLCVGWDGKVVHSVLNALNGVEETEDEE